MKAAFALFFLLISVVSFASNPDEILQPPSAFEEDRRQAEQIPAPQGLPSEDNLIQHNDQRELTAEEEDRREALEQASEERRDRQQHEQWERDHRTAKQNAVPPQRHLQPPVDPRHPGAQHNPYNRGAAE